MRGGRAERARGSALQVRIGINTGEVVDRRRRDDARHRRCGQHGEASRRGGGARRDPHRRGDAAARRERDRARAGGRGRREGQARAGRRLARARRRSRTPTPFARRLDAPLVGRVRELALLDDGARSSGARHRLPPRDRLRQRRRREVAPRARVPRPGRAGRACAHRALRSLRRRDHVPAAARSCCSAARTRARRRATRARSATLERGDASSPSSGWAVRRRLEPARAAAARLLRGRALGAADVPRPLEYVAGWSRDAPILLLCLARPELFDERPRWPGAAHRARAADAETSRQALLDELAAEWPIEPSARAADRGGGGGQPALPRAARRDGRRVRARRGASRRRSRRCSRRGSTGSSRSSARCSSAPSVAGRDFSRGAVAELSPRRGARRRRARRSSRSCARSSSAPSSPARRTRTASASGTRSSATPRTRDPESAARRAARALRSVARRARARRTSSSATTSSRRLDIAPSSAFQTRNSPSAPGLCSRRPAGVRTSATTCLRRGACSTGRSRSPISARAGPLRCAASRPRAGRSATSTRRRQRSTRRLRSRNELATCSRSGTHGWSARHGGISSMQRTTTSARSRPRRCASSARSATTPASAARGVASRCSRTRPGTAPKRPSRPNARSSMRAVRKTPPR